MKNFGINQVGIQKYQYGTPRGGLVHHQESGTWGDRGQGNELQSAFENGLSWIGDKVVNFWDYLDKGLDKGADLIFGESQPTKKQLLAQQLRENPNVTLIDSYGNETPYTANVINTGIAPLPSKFGTTTTHKLLESSKVPLKTKQQMAPLLGRARAGNVMKDPKVIKAQEIRKALYERFKRIFKQDLPEDNSQFRTKTPAMKSINTEDIDVSKTNSPIKDPRNIGGYYNKREHSIYIPSHTRNSSNINGLEDTGFHETIHAFGLGEGPSYAWKVKYLNLPETKSPYWKQTEEIAAHTIQAGQKLGIIPGQPYPGKEAFQALVEKEGLGGIALLLYNNAKNNKDYMRLWSLLNGTF